jgi:DNA repair protein RecN (Recombination protein N)
VFDEVDTGIGGRVADVVGVRLHALASSFQVLCITHLPQIAAYADSHYRISKHVEKGRTRTDVVRLDDVSARVDELARMLGGATISESVRSSAREMIQARESTAGKPAASESTAKGESETAKAKAVRRRQ